MVSHRAQLGPFAATNATVISDSALLFDSKKTLLVYYPTGTVYQVLLSLEPLILHIVGTVGIYHHRP